VKAKTVKLPPPELRAAGIKRVAHVAPAGAHINGVLVLNFLGLDMVRSLGAELVEQPEPEFPFLKVAE
jgi:hypothetical protein